MKFEGTATIPAPQHDVWQMVNDLTLIGDCIPGLQALAEVVRCKRYRLTAAANLGTYRPTLNLELTQTAARPLCEARFCLRGKGSGSHVGASVTMLLSRADDGSTEVRWSFFLAASGRLAQVESWLLETAIRRASMELIRRLCSRLQPRQVARRPALAEAS